MKGFHWHVPLALTALIALTGGDCSKSGIAGDFCDDDVDCRRDQNCVANTCLGVCFGVQAGDGSAGALCTSDTGCDSLSCDDSERISTCTCDECVPDFADIGGTPENPVIWEEKFTCTDVDNQCFGGGASDNNESITFSLVQDGKNVTGTVVSGQGEGDVFEGELCGNKFQWVDVTPGVVDPEQGCWTFTANSFNKRSAVRDEFECVGIGSRGAGSVPPDVISCEDLGSETFSGFSCAPPPPAEPQNFQ